MATYVEIKRRDPREFPKPTADGRRWRGNGRHDGGNRPPTTMGWSDGDDSTDRYMESMVDRLIRYHRN